MSDTLAKVLSAIPTPSLVIQESIIQREIDIFCKCFSWDRIFFAMKVSPNPKLIEIFTKSNFSFDVASASEIESLLKLNVASSRMILANPVKTTDAAKSLFNDRIAACVVDSPDELDKLIEVKNGLKSDWAPKVILRMKATSKGVEIDLNDKFGCDVATAVELISKGEDLGLPITGLSFHVGSQSYLIENYERAIKLCFDVLDLIPSKQAARVDVIDIGGGFPSLNVLSRYGQSQANFYKRLSTACSAIKARGLKVWSEPGRALATEGIGILSEVIGTAEKNDRRWLFLDEGKYGAYSGKYQDFQSFTFEIVKSGRVHSTNKVPWTISGPTCDSTDIVAVDVMLPKDLGRGDRIFSPNLGAYSYAFACPFNGFLVDKVTVV